MYGIPETQDFWVLFYRSDITDKLGIAIPNTWDDVVGILPQLQRLGLNFYEPLSSYTGLKPFVATLPFLYQFGGSLYSEDGMTTTLSSEANIKALKFMTDLFTIYNVPQEVTNFYNYFRYGTLPIGIANSATYLQLLVAAPEIKGNWDLALHPGYEDASGNVYHYATTGSQGITMFNHSKKQQQAFDFIKWWMSTDVQKEFILNLQSMYGEEYMWFTANNEAFDALPIPTSHKELIKEQWSWAMEASRIPAAYMVERSISDAFSKIVFNGENTRIALDDAVIDANREIARKMEEFGYMKNGVKIKDYIVPTIYNIDQWLTEEGD
jgi:ABC-type glycerol-3-phosphate transport system substrate-binding protein